MSDVITAITLAGSYVTRQYYTYGQYKIRSTYHNSSYCLTLFSEAEGALFSFTVSFAVLPISLYSCRTIQTERHFQ